MNEISYLTLTIGSEHYHLFRSVHSAWKLTKLLNWNTAEARAGACYEVNLSGCNCPSFKFRGTCKHWRALAKLQVLDFRPMEVRDDG